MTVVTARLAVAHGARSESHLPSCRLTTEVVATEINAMDHHPMSARHAYGFAAGLLVLATTALSGCQIDVAGQTLPSPYYLTDDIQYYAPGPEFKLAKEAAALKRQNEAIASTRQQPGAL